MVCRTDQVFSKWLAVWNTIISCQFSEVTGQLANFRIFLVPSKNKRQEKMEATTVTALISIRLDLTYPVLGITHQLLDSLWKKLFMNNEVLVG